MAKKEKVVEETIEQPKVDETVEKLKVKKPKMKKFQEPEDGIIKVDLKELTNKAKEVTKVDLSKPVEEIKVPEETPVLQEITNETETEKVAEVVEKEIIESIETGKDLPENVQKLMNFMEDTGGDLKDYVNLNKDYSEMDNHSLLKEYYKTTKPHLQTDEIDFLMEDQFSFDEEVDEERDIKRKKLALKEQVASAKTQLEENKSKYYDEIKSGSKLTKEQQEAINFHQKSMEEQEHQNTLTQDFERKTNRFFGDQFKGFEYNVGEKKFRINVNDANKIKETQSDLWNFWGKFLDGNSNVQDEAGYHKSMYTAMNADAIANHFYEQGRSDAVKESVTQAKNIDMAPRQEFGDKLNQSGVKVKVLNDDGPDFKFKIKQK
jgi:hypothetical protein